MKGLSGNLNEVKVSHANISVRACPKQNTFLSEGLQICTLSLSLSRSLSVYEADELAPALPSNSGLDLRLGNPLRFRLHLFLMYYMVVRIFTVSELKRQNAKKSNSDAFWKYQFLFFKANIYFLYTICDGFGSSVICVLLISSSEFHTTRAKVVFWSKFGVSCVLVC